MTPIEPEDSSPIPFSSSMISQYDFSRLEKKVDKITDALNTLIRVEERLGDQGRRIGDAETAVGKLEVKIDLVDKKVDKWINRGIGIWALVVTLWTVFEFLSSRGLTFGVK